ncbi:AMP-binding protein [Pseudonocardia sp. NPDC049154]|uniref:AMP-binding protein n=1 Tax=Pseudonocardia sp. NPDC049154 TaxID=3155501 RepID=UPI0033EAA695
MYPGVHSATMPDRPALVMVGSGNRVTWAELDARSAALAAVWRRAGLAIGDVVLLALTNDVRWAEIAWSCWRSGLVLAPVDTHLRADELAPLVEMARPAAVVVGTELVPTVRAAVGLAGVPDPMWSVVGQGYDQMVSAARPEDAPPETMGGRLLFSSGTTGRPKPFRESPPGVHPREVSLRYATMMTDLGVVPRPGEEPPTFLSPGPAYHTAPMGFLHAVQQLGGTVVMAERFDAEQCLSAIERHEVTHSLWVPTMFVRMLRLSAEVRGRYDLDSHRVAVHGAAPCPPTVKQAMLEWWGPILHEYYGSSEGYGRTSIGPEEWLAHPGSVGRAKGGSIRIADAEGRDLPAGETGRVWLVRDGAPEPLRRPDGGADLAATPGWGCAGDLGRLDDQGYLYLSGRSSELIITGGVNVYPPEVEDVLALHPAVEDVAVFGVPDGEFGEQVRAAVQPLGTPGPGLATELVEYCRQRLAPFKCPRVVYVVERLPRTETGKVRRADLQALSQDR